MVHVIVLKLTAPPEEHHWLPLRPLPRETETQRGADLPMVLLHESGGAGTGVQAMLPNSEATPFLAPLYITLEMISKINLHNHGSAV